MTQQTQIELELLTKSGQDLFARLEELLRESGQESAVSGAEPEWLSVYHILTTYGITAPTIHKYELRGMLVPSDKRPGYRKFYPKKQVENLARMLKRI